MFALPNPSVTLSALIVAVAIGLAVIIALTAFHAVRSRSLHPASDTLHAESGVRKCRYCRRGQAVLRDEAVRLDGEDLVGVRCYVCGNCGLPQWLVERRGISPRVR